MACFLGYFFNKGRRMRVHFLQHEAFESPASIVDWASARGYSFSGTHLYKGETPPRPYEVDFLVVMGGAMNIHEEEKHPWLAMEKNYIGECVERGVRTLGVCLGAQLLADVLGGRVTRNEHKEIGWFPVSRTPDGAKSPYFSHLPDTFDVMHWHGDTFSIPRGCKHLATSEACANQAFSFEAHALGLQFHLEFKRDSVDRMLENCGDELREAQYVHSAERIRTDCLARLDGTNKMLDGILDIMVKL